MKVKRLILLAAVFLMLAAPIPALAWGIAPTHYSMLYDLLNDDGDLPEAITANPQAFVQAAVGPDLAWTPLFRTTGRSYIHSLEFAESLYAVAKNDMELAMAYGFGAHLAADAAGEVSASNPNGFIPEAEPLHQLVEVAMDTVIFYTFPLPDTLSSWDQVYPSFDANLLFRASIYYSRQVERVPLVWPWMAQQALRTLEATTNAEFDYLELKQDPCLSLAFLNELAGKGLLPSADFMAYYDLAVEAAGTWIAEIDGQTGQLTETPVPASLLLLGSGLLGLGLLGRRRQKS